MMLLLVLGVLLLFFSPLLCWFDRRNLIVWLSSPLPFLAYLLPLYLFGSSYQSEYAQFERYSEIVFYGGLAFSFGCILGKVIPSITHGALPVMSYVRDEILIRRNERISIGLLLFCCLLLMGSFLYMRMVPMFAQEPLMAKFFRGQYKEKYEHVAIFYRFATSVIPVVLPLAIIALYNKFRLFLFFVICVAILLMVLTLLRGPTGLSILVGLFAIVFYRYTKYSYVFLFLYFLIYSFGSALIWMLGLATGNVDSLLAGVMAGVPDLSDQLSFLDAFEMKSDYTYGLTFLGGLVPGGFKWNPAVYTLSIINDTNDISEIASGGFRLLSPLWGYVSFGFIGVIFVPFLSGLITAMQVNFIKVYSENSLFFVMSYLYSSIFIGFFVRFYIMSMYSIPLMLIIFGILYVRHGRLKIRHGDAL